MSNEEHTFSLSFTELYKLFFKNKKCPGCNGPTQRSKKKIDKGSGWHTDSTTNQIEVSYGQQYEYRYVYRCDNCNTERELKDI